MKKLLFFVALVLLYTSCQQQDTLDISNLTLEEVNASILDKEKVEGYVDQLNFLQEDGELTEDEISYLGDKTVDYDLAVSVLIVRYFMIDTDTSEDSAGLSERGSYLYKWNGTSKSKKYYFWGSWLYKCKYAASSNHQDCEDFNIAFIYYPKKWVCRSEINCSPYPSIESSNGC